MQYVQIGNKTYNIASTNFSAANGTADIVSPGAGNTAALIGIIFNNATAGTWKIEEETTGDLSATFPVDDGEFVKILPSNIVLWKTAVAAKKLQITTATGTAIGTAWYVIITG